MRAAYWIVMVAVLLFVMSGAFAYSGFNRYYYTDNYYPTVYMPAPYAVYSAPYVYSATYYRSYPVIAYPVVYAPTYYAPTYSRSYSNMSIYSDGDGGWGFSIGRGTVCGYYGYC